MKISGRLLIAIGALILLEILGFAVSYKISSYPYFCGTCHEDRAEVRAWAASPHREIPCRACHDGWGATGLIRSQTRLATFVFRHLTGLYNDPVKSGGRPDSGIMPGTCERCHTERRTATPQKGILINHKRHAEKGIACVTCHNRISHPGIKGYPDFMRMKECSRCHGFEKTSRAPGRCETCHTNIFDLMPKSHKTKAWEPRLHPILAKKDRASCDSCHPSGFCMSCHRLPMPHPLPWVKTGQLHAKTGSANPKICRRCHTGENFCSSCHHKGYRPKKGPWVRQHFKIVRAKGVYPCFRCHEVTYCSFCHIRGVPRSPLKP